MNHPTQPFFNAHGNDSEVFKRSVGSFETGNAKALAMSGENGTKQPKIPATDDDLAIALGYSPNKDQAPRVLAKGQGWVAQQIIEVAEANGIEIRKDADLAQILSHVDVDSEIPLEAFTLVAEMLSYIYQKNRVWPEGLGPDADKSQSGTPKGGGSR